MMCRRQLTGKKKVEVGFTLLEVALAIGLISLMVGLVGGIFPLLAERARQTALKQGFSEMRIALIGYAITHVDAYQRGYLPCPALPDTNGLEGARGVDGRCLAEVRDGVVWGNWPSTTLGVGRTDPWGRPFRYGVTVGATNANAGIQLETAAPPLSVCLSAAEKRCQRNRSVADHVAVVWLSYGPHAQPRHPDERHNLKPSRTVVSRRRVAGEAGFDDEVSWMPLGLIQAALLEAGRLP